MAESTTSRYKRLFELRILHHYWLDNGSTLFDLLDDAVKVRRLLTYDVRQLISLTPTESTQKTLKKLGGIYRATTLGCVVAVPDGTPVPADTRFDLILTVQDPAFFQYTALTLSRQTIREYYNRASDGYDRYKTGVPVLSNLTGISRTINGVKSLFLSKEIPTLAASANAKVESLARSGAKLVQLTSSQPDATTQQLAAQANTQPVYLHQDDVPLIDAPPALSEFPPTGLRGIQLSAEIPDNVYTLVRITAERPGDADFSCVVNGLPKAVPPVFEIRFKNRSTIWQYIDKRTGDLLSTEPDPLPLTLFSEDNNTRLKPSPDSIQLSADPDDAEKITGLFSQILK
ncbi:hypothetical protein [Spirosoma fluviale]|uniref:Uncharacterized protein n=1 Tax=Spirosoma fluviale TaxID=1597977 RepID=A0A286GBG9_9BACT|nr:hypothetical protein [Spirosoma fluviale]SOD92842.1 hypothetical protein SAMN06269250_4219 [Spirosoma fluviale]